MDVIPARTFGAALLHARTGGRPVERVAYVLGVVLLASGLVHLGVLLVTGATWFGPVSMRKPMTFGLSFGLTLATVAWVTSLLTMGLRTRTVLLGVFSAVSVVETALVTMQAWRGVPSHVNFETPFDTGVSMALAGGGGVIIVTVLAFATAALRGAGGLAPSMRLAVRSGFALLVVGLAVGAVMIATGVGEARSGDPLLAYSTLGTLKPVHGVALHAVLVLPAIAWLLGALDWSERRRVRVMRSAVVGYALLVAVTGAVSVL
ncbi:hypothetical protein [Pseudonocardia aurantiaca]|uniref:Uncharacterized protein n=1 Tax=Pseudonocardia aurantiaca TaxID=75290 RepID=A0ABW4FI79_9PSEU